MAIYDLIDFSDLVASIREELKIQDTDTVNINRIKRLINEVYLDEVVPFKRWLWTTAETRLEFKPYFASGTASVTPDSTTVTLSTAPSVASGSRAGYLFATDSFDEIYYIASHTAGSTTVTLSSAYTGALNATAAFKIWTDELALPSNCKETVEVTHNRYGRPLEGKGLQEFRKITSLHPKAEGRPSYYAPYDYRDPSSGSVETETDRYRVLKIYPSINTTSTTLHIDYIKEVDPLEEDGDEPVMAREDRIVLKYGVLAIAWASIMRNPEEAARNQGLFDRKLARMAGKIEDGFDKPLLAPDSRYMQNKRARSGRSRMNGITNAGGSGYTSPTYIKDATIEGGLVTANITVNSGITIDGRDLSVDGAAADAHIAATSGVHGATGSIVGTTDTQTLTNKSISGATNTITAIPAANVVNTPTGNLAAVTVQGALDELQTDVDTRALASDLTTHLADTTTHGTTGAIVGISDAQVLTNKTIDADLNTITNIENADIKAAAAIAVNKLAAVTADRALVSDGSGFVSPATTTATEIGYVNGVTSGIQTQLDAKQLRSTLTAKGDLYVATASNTVTRLPVGSNGQVLKANSGVTEGVEWGTGGGGGSGINYIDNGGAETDTSGWVLYEDAAGTRPVNGTGVATSNEITFTRSTSNPLRDTASFLITKDAANRQGEGVSYDFTIDDADKAKVLSISFDYEIASGTYATGDIGVYIYDVTNGGDPIQPSGFEIVNVGIESKHVATFQTNSNSTSYRLIFHVASTSASAYTVKIDNVQVGPQSIVYGAPVTDWSAFTPTGSWSANTTYTGFWKRVGDAMEVQIKVATSGVPTTASLTINLPSGYSIDTAKLTHAAASASTLSDRLGLITDASGVFRYAASAVYSSATDVAIISHLSDGTNTQSSTAVTQASPMAWAASDTLDISFKVPISGWSSSVQMSDSADTRVVAAAYSTANVTITAANSGVTKIPFTVLGKDGVSGYNTTTGVYTVKVPGQYFVNVNTYLQPAGGTWGVSIYQNSTVKSLSNFVVSGTNQQGLTFALLDCIAGDTIDVRGSVISGASDCTFGISSTHRDQLTIHRLSGPSAIASSESVTARYSTDAGQSIDAASQEIINFEDVDFDSHGAVTVGASWKFTAPISGKYSVKAVVRYASANWLDGSIASLSIFKNGSVLSYLDTANAQAALTSKYLTPLVGSDEIRLLAGDYIDLRTDHGEAAGRTLQNYGPTNHVVITRVGNY